MPELARTPTPPYFAVIFSNTRTPLDAQGYAQAAQRMLELASLQPGYLGVDSVRGADGLGITVSYWDSLEAIARWRRHAEHARIQSAGRERWYERFELRVARVEAASSFPADPQP